MTSKKLVDEQILLTDNERRFLAMLLGTYEKSLSEKSKDKEAIKKQIKMKDVLMSKMWGK